MENLENKKQRQHFLSQAINRNVLIEKLKNLQSDAEKKALRMESYLIEELIEAINNKDFSKGQAKNRIIINP